MPATTLAVAERARRGVGVSTPERLRHSGEGAVVVADVQRMEDWPLRQLHRRGAISERQRNIGERLYEHYFRSGLIGYKPQSIEPRSPSTNGQYESDTVASHRQSYAKAIGALEGKVQQVVRWMVLDEVDATTTGLRVFGREDAAQARAVATEFLVEGLDQLGKHWGM